MRTTLDRISRTWIRFAYPTILGAPTKRSRLAAFRVAFALVGICYALGTLSALQLRWHDAGYNFGLITALHLCWIGLLVLMILGVGGRIRSLVHFLLTLFLLDPRIGTPVGVSVQDSLYLTGAFWTVFIDLDGSYSFAVSRARPWLTFSRQKNPVNPSGWPVVMLGFNLGLIIFSAGVHKAFDPLWLDGTGFYMALSLPWIHAIDIPSFADQRWLMSTMTYASIAMECLFVVFFVFARTRLLSLLLITPFFAGLVFPMRLDFIGEIGLTFVLLLSAVVPPMRWFGRDGKRSGDRRTAPDLASSHADSRWRIGVYTVLALGMVHSLAMNLFESWDTRKYDYYETHSVSASERPPDDVLQAEVAYRDTLLYKALKHVIFPRNGITDAFEDVNKYTTQIKKWTLFTRKHTIGIYVYRVRFELRDGGFVEPMVLFNEDMSGGPRTQQVFVTRHVQATMYSITDVANQLSVNPGTDLAPRHLRNLHSVVSFAFHELPGDQQEHVTRVLLDVRPINRALQGPDWPEFIESHWANLYTRDWKTGTEAWGQPEPHEIQSRVQGLPNFWLTDWPGF